MIINIKDFKLIPNIISVFRLFLVIPLIIIFTIYNHSELRNIYLIELIILAFLTDITDGFIARKFNMISELGKIIDPLADKVFLAILILSMFVDAMLPKYFMLIVLSRDIIIFSGSVLIKYRYNIILQSDYIGKFTVLIIGVTLISILVSTQDSTISFIFILISVILCFISLINYFIRFLNINKRTNG